MNHTALKHRALPLTLAALTAGSILSSPDALAATAKHTYKGPTTDFRWGTLQVSIVVKSKKITTVKTAYSVHTSRSEFITSNALPELKQEVLQAQSANIDTISRATDTSEAYIESLQAAVQKAVTARTLPSSSA